MCPIVTTYLVVYPSYLYTMAALPRHQLTKVAMIVARVSHNSEKTLSCHELYKQVTAFDQSGIFPKTAW